MKRFAKACMWAVVAGFLGCGGGDSPDDASAAGAAGGDVEASAGDDWSFEVTAPPLEIPRTEGSVLAVVEMGPMKTVRGSARNAGGFTGSAITFTFTGEGPGTYDATNLRMRAGESHVCLGIGSVEVESVEPLVAEISGEARCWEGARYGPEDPDRPGMALEPVVGTFTARLRQ